MTLPAEWAGPKEAYKSVTELMAISQGTIIKETSELKKREVQSPPNSPVRIVYLLVNDWSGPWILTPDFVPIFHRNMFQH